MNLDPEEILNWDFVRSTFRALGSVKTADFSCKALRQRPSRFLIGVKIQMLDFLAHNPGGHWIDVKADHVAAYPIGFKERDAATHEGISDNFARERIGFVERGLQRLAPELRQRQAAEKSTRSPREPLVDGDYRPIVLLNLLLSQRQRGHERHIEIRLNCHSLICLIVLPRRCQQYPPIRGSLDRLPVNWSPCTLADRNSQSNRDDQPSRVRRAYATPLTAASGSHTPTADAPARCAGIPPGPHARRPSPCRRERGRRHRWEYRDSATAAHPSRPG